MRDTEDSGCVVGGSLGLASGVGAVACAALDLRQGPLPRVIAAALRVGFAYLIVALYCVLIAAGYGAVIGLLLALGLSLTGELLLLLVDLLLELDDAGLDPGMLEGLLGRHPLLDLPLEALVDEVHEEVVVALHHLGETLCVWYAYFAFGIGVLQRPVVIIKENLPPRRHHNHGPRRYALDFHDALDLLLLVLSRKNREAHIQLVQNAAERPHVDGRRVPDAHHDLRRSVEATLDVRVELVVLIGATAKVDYLDAALVRLPQQDVLRLHVTVDDVVLFHVVQGDEQLDREAANQADRDALEVVALDELVEVHAQHLEGEDEVLAEDELLLDANYVLLVLWVVVAQLIQYLCLDEALLIQAFLVSEYLEGDVLLVLVVKTFEDLAEAALAEPVDDLETVADVLALLGDVLVLVVVEAVVVHAVRCGRWALLGFAFVDVEPIDGVVVEDLLLLDLH